MKFGRYEILEELGSGGFGTVYKAQDEVLGRIIALKVLHPGLLVDKSFVSRFRNEARLAAQLDHSNIVPVYDFGEHQGFYYIVMGYMPDGSLKELLQKEGTLPEEKALTILRQVSEGLSYAHKKGIIHRDLKPGNILFDEKGEARISDLGFAKALHADLSVSLTMSGGLVGTPAYMAPEAWRNKPACSQNDIYSLGCIFYEMLTGMVLFEGTSPAEVMTMHIIDEPNFSGSLPEKWKKPLLNSLAKEPSQRYPDTKSFLDDLENALKSTERKQNTRPSTKSPKYKILSGHTGDILSVDWSSDGYRVASGGEDQKVIIWHSETGEKTRILDGHKSTIRCVTWSPDGTILASSDDRGMIILWDTFNGNILQKLRWTEKTKTLAFIRQDGKSIELLPVLNISWSPDGKKLVSGAWAQPIVIWGIDSGTSIRTFGDETEFIDSITWSPNGKYIAVADTFNLNLWDVESGKKVSLLDERGSNLIVSVTWSPDGLRLASGYFDGRIVIRFLATGEKIRILEEHSISVSALAWSPDGMIIASGNSKGAINLWNPNQGSKIRTLGEHQGGVTSLYGGVRSLSWAPGSKYLASAGNDWDIRIWEI